MRFKLVLASLALVGASAVSTMLAQTAATTSAPATAMSAPASKPATQSGTTTSGPAKARTAETCLRCHPWDKVVDGSAKYTTTAGATVNPHVYVPHTSTQPSDIPDCVNCHIAHSVTTLPKAGEIDLKAVPVTWCFDACHHKKNFQPCEKCH